MPGGKDAEMSWIQDFLLVLLLPTLDIIKVCYFYWPFRNICVVRMSENI